MPPGGVSTRTSGGIGSLRTGCSTLIDPILPRIARGESAAVDECLERYGGLVWSLACRLAPSSAEDAVQEIFIDIWRNAWRFQEGAGTEVSFVSTIARRRLIDRRRRSQREPRVEQLDSTLAAAAKQATSGRVDAAEELEHVRRCLGGLGDRGREAVELSVYDGLSQSQIADRLDAPLGTVKSLIRRALIQLRDCVQSASRLALNGGVP